MSSNSPDIPPPLKSDRSPKPPRFVTPIAPGPVVVAGLTFLALIMGLMLLKTVWRTIRPGYVGILFDKASHRVVTNALEPGWAFINPLSQDIQEYPITIQTYSMVQKGTEGQMEGDDSIKVQSNEGQQLNLDVVIQYQVKRNEANLLYQDWGGAPIEIVEDRVVRQYTRSQVPVIVSQHGWEQITASKRGEIAQQVSEQLSREFSKRHLELVSFGVREVHLPASLQQALDTKIQAQQAAEQQNYAYEQAKIKAQQVKVEAQGEAEAIKVRAKAQAEANQLLSRSITADLIRYEQMQKWDGKLPVFSGNGIIPMLNGADLFKGQSQQGK
ncbi:prohibitin family protein [Coleofasciculus sp. H7-2]|uniref:prohibitin family protein n=1 Tax=Coleofasciculus sp. H7-2 TaxID=3351545 RepID=UPI00366AF796